jgi:hypothetical protein
MSESAVATTIAAIRIIALPILAMREQPDECNGWPESGHTCRPSGEYVAPPHTWAGIEATKIAPNGYQCTELRPRVSSQPIRALRMDLWSCTWTSQQSSQCVPWRSLYGERVSVGCIIPRWGTSCHHMQTTIDAQPYLDMFPSRMHHKVYRRYTNDLPMTRTLLRA